MIKFCIASLSILFLAAAELLSQSVPIASVPGLAGALPAPSACAGKANLACAIPNLYGPYGLVLPIPDGRTAHFDSSYQTNFMALNTAIATQLTLLPLASPASGFTYTYDPATGVYSRSAESFGPVLTERAETIGRHKFYFGGTFQRFRFNKLDGVDLHNFQAVFDHQISTRTGDWREQFISTQNSIDLKINQFTVFGTYGLTNKIDLSVDIPFVQVGYNVSSSATINRIVNTEPIFTPGPNGINVECCASAGGAGPYGPNWGYYFDPNNKQGSIQRSFANGQTSSDLLNPTRTGDIYFNPSKSSAAGIGDVTFRLKGTVYRTERMVVALASDLRLPTGDESNFLGSGAWGVKPFAALSVRTGWLTPHVNLGYQWNGSSYLGGSIWNGTKDKLPDFAFFSVGTDIGVTRRLTAAVDYIGQELISAPRVISSTYTSLGPLVSTGQVGTFPTISTIDKETYNQSNSAFGLKYNLFDRLIVSGNLLVALNEGGLRQRVTPLIGLSYSF
jgi:hypothetical protein